MKIVHLSRVYGDKEFIAGVKALKPFVAEKGTLKSGLPEREELAIKYGVTKSQVIDYETAINNGLNPLDLAKKRYMLSYLPKHDAFEVYFNSDIRWNDLKDMWADLQETRKRKSLKQSRLDTQVLDGLFYFVFRRLSDGHKIADVFYEASQQGILPKGYHTKEDLQREFYKRYQTYKFKSSTV